VISRDAPSHSLATSLNYSAANRAFFPGFCAPIPMLRLGLYLDYSRAICEKPRALLPNFLPLAVAHTHWHEFDCFRAMFFYSPTRLAWRSHSAGIRHNSRNSTDGCTHAHGGKAFR
jgi:hypothetical protein